MGDRETKSFLPECNKKHSPNLIFIANHLSPKPNTVKPILNAPYILFLI